MYTALYRKYRPLVFDDVLSQPHNTITLRNQVRNNTTAHAYLFTGSRGTGKTTCARILAKAVNCENPKDGNPCLECSICKDAENSALSDIIEIDAASNNGVDDIRDLREAAAFMPERCKYRIYIIDEVHMLSPAAFNALLKIMEEPPPYVKFILATTELHKVPATVLSRCQRFDFRRIKNEDIVARIKMIAEKEGTFTVADEAAELIARLSDGGMRDALSLLDQCVAFSSEITSETVSSAAGIAGRDYLFDIMDAVSENDIARIISVTDRLYAMSKDMQRLCAISVIFASGYFESAERTTPGPETPTFIMQSGSPTPWNAPAINGLSSTALQNTTSFAAPKHWLSTVFSAASRTIRPIMRQASRLIPVFVEPIFTDEHTQLVEASASGMEFISLSSPAENPF